VNRPGSVIRNDRFVQKRCRRADIVVETGGGSTLL
jgi:hypothetical protein